MGLSNLSTNNIDLSVMKARHNNESKHHKKQSNLHNVSHHRLEIKTKERNVAVVQIQTCTPDGTKKSEIV